MLLAHLGAVTASSVLFPLVLFPKCLRDIAEGRRVRALNFESICLALAVVRVLGEVLVLVLNVSQIGHLLVDLGIVSVTSAL